LATKSAGRVSIRVLPDSSRFREDLKKSLERIEKTMKATIPAELAVTRESIRKLKEQLRELEVRIKVEPYVTQEQLHDLKDKLEDLDPNIRVDLDALNAQRRLAVLSRTRFVSLIVRVNKASVAAAMSTLAALSGARILNNVFEPLFNRIKELDKIAPKIGLISSGILGLGATLLTAVSNAAGLAGSIAALGQSAVLLPALFTAAGISIGVLVAVFKDMKTVLKDLGPSFTSLQDAMSAEFWAIAADPIRELVHTLMPSLREQLINTSQAFGVMTRELADALKKSLTADVLNRSFDNMNQAIAKASNGVAPLVRAFVTLGTFGTQYLPRLSTWLVDLANKFDRFIATAAKSGDLEKWAERGIEEFKALGRVIRETVRVFAALTRAAAQAGGASFDNLADGLKKLADLMNTANFQTTLSTIFAGAHTAMDGLIKGLGELGTGLASFAPTLAIVFSEVGKILEGVGRALKNLFSNPELQQGIQNFFSGFKTFIDTIGPGMAPLGRIIGVLATAMGNLLAQAGPLITDVLTLLAPLFEEIWTSIKPLIPDLIKLTETIIKELGPPLTTLVKEVLPPLIPIIADLIPVIADLVKAASPVLVDFFKKLGKALEEAGPFVNSFAGFAHDLATALNEFPLAMFQWFTGQGDNLDFFSTMFRIAIDHPEIVAFFTGLNTALGGFTEKIEAVANTVDAVNNFFLTIQKLAGALGLGALAVAIKVITDLLPGWETFWARFGAVVSLIMGGLPTPVKTGLATIQTGITVFQTTTGVGWSSFWGRFGPAVGVGMTLAGTQARLGTAGIAATIAGFIAANLPRWQGWLTGIQVLITTRMPILAGAVRGGIPGMVTAFAVMMSQSAADFTRGFNALIGLVPGFMARLGAGITIGSSIAISAITGMGQQMIANLFSFVGSFFEAGASLITSFVQGISSGTNPAISAAIAVVKAAMSVLPHSPAEKGPLSGQGWINLKKSGTAITKQFASGLTSDMSVVQNQMGRVVGAIQFGGAGASALSVQSAIGGATNDRRALVTIEGDYYGATPEKVAREFDTKLRRNQLASQIGKIGIG